MTCVVCEHRPAREKGICAICHDQINKETKRKTTDKPRHFLTYRGHVVGLFSVGGGELKPQLLRRKAENLPKGITLDLNHYCAGFDRTMIKSFKACVLQLSNARNGQN